MEGQEVKFNNAVVRIHFSGRTKEERNENIKKAAEKFMKQVFFQKKEVNHETNKNKGCAV